MRCLIVSFTVLALVSSQNLFASPKTDSIYAFLGNNHVKTVFTKWAWCNDDYTPKTRSAANASFSSVEFMDTRLGTQRTLASTVNNPCIVRISKSGRWVTYIDKTNTSFIADLTSTSSTAKPLMAQSAYSYWMPAAWWIDPISKDEYLFCVDSCFFHPSNNAGGTGIVKVKINSDGTVNHASKEPLIIKGLTAATETSRPVEIMMSVSADGKKLGGAFPWPDTKILDIPTGKLDSRHAKEEDFGCQTNLAPDNSYRLIHCQGDHQGIWMFDKDMSTTYWYMDLRKNIVGMPTTGYTVEEPRWTNDVQYLTASTIGEDALGGLSWTFSNYANENIDDGYFSLSASGVKALDATEVMKFYLAKFSSDFRSQERTMMIAADNRYAQGRGELWVETDPTSAMPAKTSANRLSGLSIVQSGAGISVQADGAATIRITDSQGRLVRRAAGSGSIAVDTRDLAIGAYIISAHQHGNRLTRQVMIAR